MASKYRLVLRFALAPRDVAQFDRVTQIEEELGKPSMLFEVDGHDCSAGCIEVGLLTDDPERTFEVVRTLIPSCCSYRAGFKTVASEDALEPLAV